MKACAIKEKNFCTWKIEESKQNDKSLWKTMDLPELDAYVYVWGCVRLCAICATDSAEVKFFPTEKSAARDSQRIKHLQAYTNEVIYISYTHMYIYT